MPLRPARSTPARSRFHDPRSDMGRPSSSAARAGAAARAKSGALRIDVSARCSQTMHVGQLVAIESPRRDDRQGDQGQQHPLQDLGVRLAEGSRLVFGDQARHSARDQEMADVTIEARFRRGSPGPPGTRWRRPPRTSAGCAVASRPNGRRWHAPPRPWPRSRAGPRSRHAGSPGSPCRWEPGRCPIPRVRAASGKPGASCRRTRR